MLHLLVYHKTRIIHNIVTPNSISSSQSFARYSENIKRHAIRGFNAVNYLQVSINNSKFLIILYILLWSVLHIFHTPWTTIQFIKLNHSHVYISSWIQWKSYTLLISRNFFPVLNIMMNKATIIYCKKWLSPFI